MAPRDAASTSSLPPTAAPGSSARIAWFDTIGAESERDRPAPGVSLPAPDDVWAVRGRGQVSIAWSPVEGAAGYLVHRGPSPDGPFEAIDQGGGDVLAVPHGPYLDTNGGAGAWYAVSSVPTIEAPTGRLSNPVAPDPGQADGHIAIAVDAGRVTGVLQRPWRPVIGSEHLALLLRGAGPGGHDVGSELAEAFRIVRRELGTEMVRAHGWLHDSLGVYREEADGVVHDFSRLDDVVDRLLETGLRPIVELSFMPRALASDPHVSVFDYVGIISPPRDMERWSALVRDLVAHLADRYGRDEVRRWAFEVWNEANLRVFWAASESDYFALYDATVRAVKVVDPLFRVGGPATAAAGWVDDLLEHCRAEGLPLDFISTHTYGMAPLDLRPVLARYDRSDLPLLWTEWGVSPTHGAPINDSAWAAPLVARGMRSAAGRLEALAYWVASDHFVELGEPESLFHGGFGLLTIGNLRKPRFWAIAMLERLGRDEIAATVDGDGAGSMVEAWASRDDDGRIAIAVWNGTLDQSKADGDAALDRSVTIEFDGLAAPAYDLRHQRVDRDHSNVVRTWEALGSPAWPSDDAWDRLRADDRLATIGSPKRVRPDGGRTRFEIDLPMPAVSLLELVPAD